MPGLFPTNTITVLEKRITDLPVTNPNTQNTYAMSGKGAVKPAVAVIRNNNRITAKPAKLFHTQRSNPDYRITINNIARLIHHSKPVSITVKSKTHIKLIPFNKRLKLRRKQSATIQIYVKTIRLIVNNFCLNAKLAK